MHYDMKQSGARIRSLRKQNGYTQEELARLLSIDRSFLSSIESGKKGCSVDLFIQLSGFFHISLDELILGTEQHGTFSKEKVKDSISALIDHLESFKASL